MLTKRDFKRAYAIYKAWDLLEERALYNEDYKYPAKILENELKKEFQPMDFKAGIEIMRKAHTISKTMKK